MKSKILNDEKELEEFAQRFRDCGNNVSLSYLKNAKVRAFFNKNGEMFAGYAMNLVRPLRYEEWIPIDKLIRIHLLYSNKRFCELTCIWIAGRTGRISSEIIYLYSVIDALLSGARYILGGTLSPVVYGIQTQMLPELLYKGHTDYFGERKNCWIYGASRGSLVKRILTAFPAAMISGIMGKPAYLNKARVRARKLKEMTAR